MTAVKFVYFAWVRERIGRGEETLDLPITVKTASDVINHLRSLGEEYEHALTDALALRVAVDQELVSMDESISSASEIAIFPPMTGG
ncbi:MAG: molybdopterin converting factor subunit 1 [Pseudomonadota bacterium]